MDILQSKLGDFYTLDGQPYKGSYYIEKGTNIAYTYSPNTKKRKVLVPYYVHNTETVRMRNSIKGGYKSPTSYKPSPTDYDYRYGYIVRYFLQKRTSPQNSIVEVSENDFQSVSPNPSSTKIDERSYNSLELFWTIAGNKSYVAKANNTALDKAEKLFPGIKNFLPNLLEYYK